eukprot:CAMPEP_0194479504 /NCGR_PEP_ID=MMETSP0253-20130528/2601_1 /TAXON_ID=2966 /ORGANISM="Noctiluca scintillans" /LENGTH=185 /DNA_ID=CAMNT_0039318739 /DNA_START=168 /DNA_END=725 /DNA_ORIENTATION=+
MEFEGKEIDHGDVVKELDPSQIPNLSLDAAAEHPQQQIGVEEAGIKLSNLPHGQVVLERISQTERRDKVVRVHENVGDRIDEGTVAHCPASKTRGQDDPPDHSDCGMVIQVQKAHLFVTFLLQNHPHCIKPVKVFREVMDKDEPLTLGGFRQSNTEHIRNAKNGKQTDCHVQAQDNLENIVQLHH